MEKRNALWLKTVLKASVVIGCFWIIAQRIDGQAVQAAFLGTQWRFVLAAGLMLWMEPIVAAIKWRRLMTAHYQAELPPRLALVIRVVFTANFLSLMMPTALSADALRLWLMGKKGVRLAHSGSAMLADRALGLGALLLMALIGGHLARHHLPATAYRIVPWICWGGLAAIGAAFLPVWSRLLRVIIQPFTKQTTRPSAAMPRPICFPAIRLGIGKLLHTAEQLLTGFQEYRKMPTALFQAGIWNMVIQILRIVQAYMLFRALGHPIAFVSALAFMPLIVILSMLPITFYGMGIKEGAFVYLFSQVGIPNEISLTVSLLTYPLILSALIPGLLFFLIERDSESNMDDSFARMT